MRDPSAPDVSATVNFGAYPTVGVNGCQHAGTVGSIGIAIPPPGDVEEASRNAVGTEGSDNSSNGITKLALPLVAAGGEEDEPMEMPTRFMNIDVDPILCLIPGATRKEYERIKADIAIHGLREPVKRVGGRWVDGRLRLMACLALGIIPNIIDLPDDTDTFAFVMSSNAHRRHLTKLQLAVIAVTSQEWATTGFNQHGGGSAVSAHPATTQEVADKIGVSRRLIYDAKLVHKAGLDQDVLTQGLSRKQALAEATKRLQSQGDTEEQAIESSQDGPADRDKASARPTSKKSPRVKLPADVAELQRLVRLRDDLIKERENEIEELAEALEREQATTRQLKDDLNQLRQDIAQLRSQSNMPVRETLEPWPAGDGPSGQVTGSSSRIQPKETQEPVESNIVPFELPEVAGG